MTQTSHDGPPMTQPLILLTNDDGIASPGLAAAAAGLASLGELLIVAPATQQTSMGRSRTQQGDLDGRLFRTCVIYGDQSWPGVGAHATPALTVEYGLRELAPRPVDLVVSGINYGENVSTCVTVSGTLGAAFEATERGIPAIAFSLETGVMRYYDHDPQVDFTAAMHFVRLFAQRVLQSRCLPPDVDVLKVDVPAVATPATPSSASPDRIACRITRPSRRAAPTPSLDRQDHDACCQGLLHSRRHGRLRPGARHRFGHAVELGSHVARPTRRARRVARQRVVHTVPPQEVSFMPDRMRWAILGTGKIARDASRPRSITSLEPRRAARHRLTPPDHRRCVR